MGKWVLNVVIAEVNAAKYFLISVDSTPDVSHTDQLTVVIRYVTSSMANSVCCRSVTESNMLCSVKFSR